MSDDKRPKQRSEADAELEREILEGRKFTLLFEAFAVRVLQAANNVKRAAALLGLDWDSVHRIMERAVERGLARRSLEEVRHVGLDEKRFRRGHDYLSVLTDLSGARVLAVSEGRDQAGADRLWAARLTGSKQLWLFNPENLSDDQWLKFEPLKDQELKTAQAWAIKEQFRWFWEYRYADNAR